MSEPKKFIDLQFCTEFDIHPHYNVLLFISFTLSDSF
jgi:hypothetical protein